MTGGENWESQYTWLDALLRNGQQGQASGKKLGAVEGGETERSRPGGLLGRMQMQGNGRGVWVELGREAEDRNQPHSDTGIGTGKTEAASGPLDERAAERPRARTAHARDGLTLGQQNKDRRKSAAWSCVARAVFAELSIIQLGSEGARTRKRVGAVQRRRAAQAGARFQEVPAHPIVV